MKYIYPVLLLVLFHFALARSASSSQVASKQVEPPIEERIITYGKSLQGRPLEAVVLGTGNNVTAVLGGIHGNELSVPGVVEDLKEYLERNPQLLIGCTVVLVAHVNPDGDRAHTRANADGVDLNRNFPVGWLPARHGIALSPGTSPVSEPESAALIQLLRQTVPSKIVSIHQPLHCLLPSGPGGESLAQIMARNNSYQVKESVGYPVPGALGSYCYKAMQTPAVTLEMPSASVVRCWHQNRNALLAAIRLSPPSD